MSKVADGGNALCFLFRRLNFLCFRVLVSFQCVVSVKRVTSQSVCKVFFCSLRIANCYGKFGHHVWRCNLTKVNDRVFSSFLSKKAGHPAHHRHPAYVISCLLIEEKQTSQHHHILCKSSALSHQFFVVD